MLKQPLLYYDKLYLYEKNLVLEKYWPLVERMEPISNVVGYDIIDTSSNNIIP